VENTVHKGEYNTW